MKLITKICLTLLATTALASLPVSAQTTNTATNSTPAPHRMARAGYRGKISAVDSVNMTLTVTGKQGDFKVKVTSKTKISKDAQPATFGDAVEGLNVSGQGAKDADGNWAATTLRLTTPKTKAAAVGSAQ